MRVVFEKVHHAADVSFACQTWDAPSFDCPFHVHPEIEIVQILQGHGSRVVGDHLGNFAPGELLLLGAGLPHMYVDDVPADVVGAERSRSRYVQFLPDCLGPGWLDLPEMRQIRKLVDWSRRGLAFDPAATARASDALDALWAATGAARISRLIDVLDALAGADQVTPLASEVYQPLRAHTDSGRLERVLTHINRNLKDGIRLEDASKVAYLTPEAFSRFFHRYMGRTFIDYVISLRVSRACRLLLETDRSVTEIAFEAGFQNLSNFNRQFRRIKGTTPRSFRQLRSPDADPPVVAAP